MQAPPRDPGVRAPLPTVAAYLLGVGGIAFGITLLFLGMRAVMDIGGFCAEGGPYVIESACPEGTAAATLLGIFGGLAGFFVAFWTGVQISPRAVGLLLLAWPALFGVMGFNFLQYGFDPPGDEPGWAWSWLVCGVVFWVIAFGPLLVGLRAGAGSGGTGSAGRLVRAAPGGARLAGRSPARSSSTPSGDPSATFPMPLPSSVDAASQEREPDIVDGLERLAALHRAGSITDDEYARAKTELLDRGGA